MEQHKILLVDDETNLLHALARQLKRDFSVDTAESGPDGLAKLATKGPFSVVISDLRMPGMDGIRFLAQVKKHYPNTIRIVLSGNADLEATLQAVNTGQVFRFLIKPCSKENMQSALKMAIRQYELLNAERDLLNQTVKGSISMLCEMLSISNAKAFSTGQQIRKSVVEIATALDLGPLWQYEIAALLCQIGCIGIPLDIQEKMQQGHPVTETEQQLFAEHPGIGEKIIAKIPRLEKVAAIVGNQLRTYEDLSASLSLGQDIVMGASLLKAVLDFNSLLNKKIVPQEAISRLYRTKGIYHADILSILSEMSSSLPIITGKIIEITFDDLLPGMRIADDLKAHNDNVIIPKGQIITWPVLEGLLSYSKYIGIQQPIRIWQTHS